MILKIIALIILLSLLLELLHQFRLNSPLILKPKSYKANKTNTKQTYTVWLEIFNSHKSMEVMIPSFKVNPKIIGISKEEIGSIKNKIKISNLNDLEYKDDYFPACIIKSQDSTSIKVVIEFEINEIDNNKIECIWLDIEWINYGPFGICTRFDGLVIPNLSIKANDKFSSTNYIQPVKTHILGSLDDPIKVLKYYLPKNYLPTDILTIGESPLSTMQGRYIDYKSLNISFLAKILCKGFHPTSSLATACGMQTLINISRPTRVLFASIIGGISKLFGIKGLFYRLAGDQARLIDDITGTTPPYDKSIVLGPIETQLFCRSASKQLGINVAIVDVNDLGRVKILSVNNPKILTTIKNALSSNPAGNSNQHTPIVLIRPSRKEKISQVK
tara:strand:- start:132 stop:1295 length:1164 start_codon:yes stop_codon:yes gene_type:complete